MILHAFYNPINVGDVLLVRLGSGVHQSNKQLNDLTILFDKDNKVIGYNIFNATNHFTSLNEGLVKMTSKVVDEINTILNKNQLDPVHHDGKSKFIVGFIESFEKHPDSDHLNVCQVNLGNESTQIVCGASNVAVNRKVVVATIGAVMPSGLIIQPSVLRKVESNGMLCSAKELKIEIDSTTKGILLLEDSYVVGEEFM